MRLCYPWSPLCPSPQNPLSPTDSPEEPNFLNNLPSVWAEAQAKQIGRWLLNYRLYAVVIILLILSLLIPVYKWTTRTSASLFQDYFYGIFHTIVAFPIIALCIVLINDATDRWMPWMNLHLYKDIPGYLQIIIAALLTDFLRFTAHFLRHKIKYLWYFHTIHHSQEELNPFTTKRTHIVEKSF